MYLSIYIYIYIYDIYIYLRPPYYHETSNPPEAPPEKSWQTPIAIGPVADELYQVGSTMVGKHLFFLGGKGDASGRKQKLKEGVGKNTHWRIMGFPLFLICFFFFWGGGGG